MKAIPVIFGLMISTPIWFYLLYQILVRVNASELMFFLFWIYVPAGIFVAILAEIVKSK